jgi:HEAT repeat protein
MQSRLAPITIAVLLTTIVSAASRSPQERRGSPAEVEQILRQFNDDDWKVRSEAFDRLYWIGESDGADLAGPIKKVLANYPDLADRIKLGLIGLLERENAEMEKFKVRFEKTGQLIGRDYNSDYYGNVIAAVVTLKDVRSMNALLGAITTGGMAMGTLASFAPSSLDPVLAKTTDADDLVRNSALHVLAEMLSPSNRDKVDDTESHSKIKGAFLRAVQDPVAIVRSTGAFGLGELGDLDAIPVLERLASDDPFFLPDLAGGGRDFTVRRAARRALERLKERNKQEPTERK